MSKIAENKALEAYPIDKLYNDVNLQYRIGYEEGYDQAMQDFLEKTCKWLKESITNNPECNRIISKKGVITMGLLIEDFKNYMQNESEN